MINNIGDQRLPKITLKSSQDHLRLKRGWYKDDLAWLHHWGVEKNATLKNINHIIKNSITSNFKENMWGEKEL